MEQDKEKVVEKRPFYQRGWFQNIMLLLGLIVIGALVVGYTIVERQVSPKFVLAKYMDWYGTGNLEELWKEADQPESAMVTKEMFEEWCMKGRESKLLSYEYTKEKEDDKLIYHVTFLEEESNEEKFIDIYLIPTGEKKYLFFPVYRYSIEDQIADNAKFAVVQQAEFTLDGREMTEYYTETKDGYDIYTVPQMLKGTYRIEINSSATEDIKEDFVVSGDGMKYKMDVSSVMSAEESEKLKDSLREAVLSMYQKIIENDSLKADAFVKSVSFPASENGKKELQSVFKNLREQMYSGTEKSIVVDHFYNNNEIKFEQTEYKTAESASYEYVFQYDYEGKTEYDIMMGVDDSVLGRREVDIKFKLILKDNSWTLDKMSVAYKELERPEEEQEE